MAVSVRQPSSRESAAGAGWKDCGGPGAWKEDVPPGAERLSWLRPKTLWIARNDVLAKYLSDPVDRARAAWVRMAVARGGEDLVFSRAVDEPVAFLLIGDPGEGDDTQYAVVPALLSQAADASFTIICSDVIYPSGELGDYRDKFFRPYRGLEMPIVAVPGNHDWYDGLHGFMANLCGIDAPQAPLEVAPGWRGELTRRLWRRSTRPSDEDLEAMRRERGQPRQRWDPPQPGPYWALDTGPLRIVGIDTGIVGRIDSAQAAWLRRVSFESDRPKVLVTGKPLYVNGKRCPGPITGESGTIDDIVRDRRANYVMAIGGDTHNYQRYPVRLPDGRTLQYVVSGGGGAYSHATHQIPRIALPGVDEADFRCYPLRGDSLARFAQLYDKRLAGGRGRLALTRDEARSYMAELLDMAPTGAPRVPLSARARRTARFVAPLPSARGFHRFASEFFDWNDPPFFKSFLRLDAELAALRLRCFGVSGCASSTGEPPVEDEVIVPL